MAGGSPEGAWEGGVIRIWSGDLSVGRGKAAQKGPRVRVIVTELNTVAL